MMLCSICKKRPAVIFLSFGIPNSESLNNPDSSIRGICMVCARNIGITSRSIFNNLQGGITEEDINKMSEQLANMISAVDEVQDLNDPNTEQGGAVTFLPFMKNIFADFPFPKSSENKGDKSTKEKSKKNSKRKYIEIYCDNLTRKAKEGKLDRIIGRSNEMSRLIQILSRRTKNNPCLVGEPGVGKTAIAEGLAILINDQKVPFKLKDKEICLLDLTALVAGTQFRGQFESRIKGLVDEVKNDGNIILFIDEVHNLVGTGDSEGSMSAANILKPALSRGEIQVIGATTFAEYRKYIEKDAALERRFQQIKVSEPTISEATKLILGIKSYYESYHFVHVPESLVERIVVLSERYITDRFLPDKAIDLLDESCASTSLNNKYLSEYNKLKSEISSLKSKEEEILLSSEINYESLAKVKNDISTFSKRLEEIEDKALGSSVSEEDVSKVIELWTGIPASKIQESEFKKLEDLESKLKQKIKGQDEAIHTLCSSIRRHRTRINIKSAPPSFIFVGPTGVGKTALVQELSKELFDSQDSLIRLDMSEYMEKHTVSRIIGSPPGYVGYDDAGQVTEKVRQKPYSIILFDELEKAHPDVLNILLQILDEGKLNDAQGRTINFENTIIVMTSNAGSHLKVNSLGFDKSDNELNKEKVSKALSEFLRPEFLSRIGNIVIFNTLRDEDLVDIIRLKLDELVSHLKEKGITFSYTDGAVNAIKEKIEKDNKNGARKIEKIIREEVEDKIASTIISKNTFDLGSIILNDNLEIE